MAPAAQVVELPHAQVWGQDGAVLTADGCVVEDLLRAWGHAIEDHPIWDTAPTPAVRIDGTAAVVAARGAATNFSHFLADTLPRIQLIRDTGLQVDRWVLSGDGQPWQREALGIAGIPLNQVVSLVRNPVVTADTLLVPTRTGFAPATAPWARHRLTALLQPTPRQRHRHLLISRRRAQRRRLLNDEQLAQALAAHGFEIVDFDTMPFHDQIRTVHESLTIVSVHGAALAHLLHAPEGGGHVVEITHPDEIHPEYLGLAAHPDRASCTIDGPHTSVELVARHLMITKIRGRFAEVRGAIFIAEDPEQSNVEAEILAASVNTGNVDRDAHLRGPDFFDVDRHPIITFRSTATRARAESTWEVRRPDRARHHPTRRPAGRLRGRHLLAGR